MQQTEPHVPCVQFTAVPQSIGAPLRTVTVRDAIADLPAIQNGHDQDEMEYSGEHPPFPPFHACSSCFKVAAKRQRKEYRACKPYSITINGNSEVCQSAWVNSILCQAFIYCV